mgnify:FL=1
MITQDTPSPKQRTVTPTNIAGMGTSDGEDVELNLMSAYVAGVIDSTGTIGVSVQKQQNTRLGYTIRPMVSVRRTQGELVGIIDNWAMEHGIRGKLNEYETEAGTKYEFSISARDDVETVLTHIEPFLLVKDNDVQIILNEILPRLRDGVHKGDKEGFVEIMQYADMIQAGQRRETKYTADYFRDEWNL